MACYGSTLPYLTPSGTYRNRWGLKVNCDVCLSLGFPLFLFVLLKTAIMEQLYVGNACGLGWTVRGSNPSGGYIFSTRPDRSWGPPSLLYDGYRISLPGG